MNFPNNKRYYPTTPRRYSTIGWTMRWCVAVLVSAYAAQVFAAAPVAVDDTRKISRDSSITINVVANDYDPDGNSLSVVSVSSPSHGSAVLNPDGSIFYTAE